jgi:hypothetical protein
MGFCARKMLLWFSEFQGSVVKAARFKSVLCPTELELRE